MAKEVGQKAVEQQFEIMEEQQEKAQEFIDQKVMSQMINHFGYFRGRPADPGIFDWRGPKGYSENTIEMFLRQSTSTLHLPLPNSHTSRGCTL